MEQVVRLLSFDKVHVLAKDKDNVAIEFTNTELKAKTLALLTKEQAEIILFSLLDVSGIFRVGQNN